MNDRHIELLLKCIDLEDKEQNERFRLDKEHTLKVLKAEGLAIHPIKITRKFYGYADYPELSFRIQFPVETRNFRDGASIECFSTGEDSIKGVLLNLEGKIGEIRLFSPDFPDWIENNDVGIKLAPDQKTSNVMKTALKSLRENNNAYTLFKKIHGDVPFVSSQTEKTTSRLTYFNDDLNDSQKSAVSGMLTNEELLIIHGPPGTGKTTTIIEGIQQLVSKGEKILVSAPSNTAVDHLASILIKKGIKFLRIGNSTKANRTVYPYTPEGKLEGSKQQKDIKKLKIRAEELRKMALQYKRNFGREERNQRNLLLREVKNIRTEIKAIQSYNEEQLFNQADVILGTPIGLQDGRIHEYNFSTLVIDEAGQCLEPLAWCIIPLAKKIVLAGDHLQLPPTVLSQEAIALTFNQSILEVCIARSPNVLLLNTQYRMHVTIAGFSSSYFYNNLLQTAERLKNNDVRISFYDTAGAGYTEESGESGLSLMNSGEIKIVQKIIEIEGVDLQKTALISPYNGQVALGKEELSDEFKVSTIDSFQGQESDVIIVSLVRSNDKNEIGFLKDYRRMNVALTRAKERLIVIGDSSTIGNDTFFSAFLDYIENLNAYRSIWELE